LARNGYEKENLGVKKVLSYRVHIGGLFFVLFLLILPWLTTSRYFLHILIMIFYYGYLASCWNIVGGYAGQHSLGHAVFVGAGAYTSSLLFAYLGVTPWIGMWVGAIVAGFVALFLGYLSFRYGLKGPYFLLVTIAFAEVFLYLTLNIRALGGASGISIPLMRDAPQFFQFQSKMPYYYIGMILFAMVLAITYAFQRSRMGYYWIAIRENEDAAQALGVNIMAYKLWALVVSAFLSAIGGTFYAQYILFIEPHSILGLGLSIEIVLYTIVGGIGTVLGPILGVLFLVPISEIARTILGGESGGIDLMVYGGILIISIIFMPTGIAGTLSRISLWGRRRIE
jgi:branched-chain amino acid transport system permease protein